MLTIPNALAPSEDEYNIAALLGDESVREVVKIQTQLRQLLGDALWITPTNCLHITLMEVICNADYGSVPRKQLFYDWQRQYSLIAQKIIGRFPPFKLTFNELHASPAAIIIKASEPKALNDIRAALLAETKLPNGTKLPPDIGHATIARFVRPVALTNVQAAVQSIQITIAEPVTAFKLLEGIAPPRLNPKSLAAYSLNGRHT